MILTHMVYFAGLYNDNGWQGSTMISEFELDDDFHSIFILY